MNQQIKPSEIVILVSGIVAFLFSFFSFIDQGEFGASPSAWNTDSFFPLATYIAIFGLLMAVHVGLASFANVDLPPRMLSFTWPQIHFALAVFSVLIAFGYLILADDLSIGFWFMFLASAGLATGATMQLLEEMKAGMPGPYTGGPGPYPGGPPPPGPYPGQPPPPPQQF